MPEGNKELLEYQDFIVGERDPRVQTEFDGKYMVAQKYDDCEIENPHNGDFWCVVGDDLNALMEEAIRDFQLEEVV